jgi:tousled-like kinase
MMVSLLGRGGFSEVWLAFDLHDAGREVAVKLHQLVNTWSDAKKAQYVKHALRECAIQRDMDHPNIVQLLNVLEISGDAFATVLVCAAAPRHFFLIERSS